MSSQFLITANMVVLKTIVDESEIESSHIQKDDESNQEDSDSFSERSIADESQCLKRDNSVRDFDDH